MYTWETDKGPGDGGGGAGVRLGSATAPTHQPQEQNMSEMSQASSTADAGSIADAAPGGTPSEAELPGLQGLGDDVPDTDPDAGTDGAEAIEEMNGGSDPMPDMAGTTPDDPPAGNPSAPE